MDTPPIIKFIYVTYGKIIKIWTLPPNISLTDMAIDKYRTEIKSTSIIY